MFLEMLDDAIIEEADQKKEQRKPNIVDKLKWKERMTVGVNKKTVGLKWKLSCGERCSVVGNNLSAIQSESFWERGLSTLQKIFRKGTSCEEQRVWGSINHQIVILLTVARSNDGVSRVSTVGTRNLLQPGSTTQNP